MVFAGVTVSADVRRAARPCAFAADAGWSGRRAAIHDTLVHSLIPLARLHVRYMPRGRTRTSVWTRLVEPYLAWHTHGFTARTRHGFRMRGSSSDILEQYVYYFGVWEPNLSTWIAARLEPADVFVDVGANVGYYSLLASRLVRKGHVVSIEASPTIFGRLEANIALNGESNIRAVNAAAIAVEGPVTMYLGTRYHSGISSTVPEERLSLEAEVPGQPLSAILTTEEVRRARVIKIDVEGGEWAAVSGLLDALPEARPDLEVVVEISPERLAQQGHTADEVLAMFGDRGFHAYRINNDYSSIAYVDHTEARHPVRLRSRVEEETDVVFSRVEATVLP